MNKEEASHIMSSYMKAHDGKVGKDAFPAKFQRAVDRNESLSDNTLKSIQRKEAQIYQSELSKLHGGETPKGSIVPKIQSSIDKRDSKK